MAIYFFDNSHSEEKAIESLEMIFSTTKITFDSKRDIFNAILNKNLADKEYAKELNSDLQKIIEERNVFAHYKADLSQEGIELFKKEKQLGF